MEENTMANGDYGYFGKGDTGYAQYMTAFNRNFGGSSGGGGGGHNNGGGGCHCQPGQPEPFAGPCVPRRSVCTQNIFSMQSAQRGTAAGSAKLNN